MSDESVSLAGEYLVFRLGTKNYGLDILLTSEIRSYEQPSPIAQMPAFHKGLLNLRGVVVPIIDLRIVAGCEAHFDVQTVVAVISLAGRRIGVVVDAVSDVREITADQIRQVAGSPHPDTHLHIVATAGTGEEQLALMDIEGLMESLHLIIEAAK